MNKFLLGLVPLVALAHHVDAQTRQISGRVTDRTTGEGLPGATVLVKGTTNGVSTNSDGTFTLSVSGEGGTLQVSSVGYIALERPIGTDTQINVGMAPDAKTLSEIVVVGYGEQSKTLVTGAVSQVDSKQFETQPVASVEQVLQGRASGVQVNANSGTPGGGVTVRIRGNNSISASSDPLYVVDGVPINIGSYSNVGVGNQQLNAISDLNPNDIASIEILKDASAAAIYGSRAANGVVLITTKRGQAGRTKITLDAYAGVQQTWRRLDVLNGEESQNLINEARTNVGLTPRYVTANPNPATQQLFTGASTNWQDEVFRDARIQNYTLTASGGDAKTRFLISGTYFDQEGIILGSGFSRGSGRINLDHQATDKLRLGMSLTGSRSLSNRINNDNNIYGVLSTALLLGSQFPVRNADGTFGRDPFSSVENPIAAATLPTFLARNNRAIGNIYADYQIIPSLRFRTSLGGDYLNLKEDVYIPSTALQAVGSNGSANFNSRYDVGWINENTLTYDKAFGDHSLTLLLGQSAQRSVQNGIITSVSGFATNKIRQASAGSVKTDASSDETLWTLLSYFGRANYNYQGKYILSASLRRDGSSRFGAENKYGWFPAASAAWRVSEEGFLKGNPVISELKLRGGYGVVGNFEIGNFASRNLFGVGAGNLANYNGISGFAPTQLGVSDLGWEQTGEISAGVDVGVLENRISLSVNAFDRKSKDLLLNRQLPLTSGFGSVTQNIGDLRNRGLEFDLTTQNVKTDNFSWTTNLNVSIIRNKVTRLVNNAPFLAGFASRVEVGQPLGSFYGYVVDRVYQNQGEIDTDIANARARTGSATALYQGTSAATTPRPGDIRFRDLNNDGVITAADQKIIGSAQPNFFGGITNTLNWKGIDLSFFFQFTQGNEIYNNTRAFGEGMNGQFGQLGSVRDRWTPDNPSTSMPRAAWGDPNNNRRVSDRWLEDGSYLRLKTATLGYNLPSNLIRPLRLQSARVYLAGQNLLTFTKYSGLEPEVNTFSGTNTSLGTDFLTFPQARVYQVGVNIGL
ncbi:SusC/RagA family TonB-linked outer membrane protein [Hymenobacter latericus]|uniref:SusC/RagA family TonB-linked outer membrane protein n=1 Tax=Hymenobacter sp. YIM 151858-1 TaxID=2987688 RepID=UPI0022264E83|nr:TonB-dependent receptor [Hymenobacter sp. YIM 151858-1]UYZ59225.1 TonB-dependent receptor [Hymenobacter sp. YIM 151858-1]